jgi:glutamate--cysteine ligase
VFEIKTIRPKPSLALIEQQLTAGLARFARLLESEFGARLLPTGMHPFMRPEDTELWRRAGRRIYRTYDRIFGIGGHGWLNVQASHVNLPFGTEAETMRLHTAIACLIPYLPALAASSPIYDGKIGPFVDNRLAFYRHNQRRIPTVTGSVVPEMVGSFREYRGRILKPIYRALDGVPDGHVLQHEWVNSRGAIIRFMRRAIEIRVLDVQECVRSDVAIALFVRGALQWLVDRLRDGELTPPPQTVLVHDFNTVIRDGSKAAVAAPHLRSRGRPLGTARRVLEQLAEHVAEHTPEAERVYLPILQGRITRGSLSEQIAAAVRRHAARSGARRRGVIRDVYEELATCLRSNTPWDR